MFYIFLVLMNKVYSIQLERGQNCNGDLNMQKKSHTTSLVNNISVVADDCYFLSYRFPKDAALLLLLLVYSPVGFCLMLLRIFIGIHVFLVSCALPESFVRRYVIVMTPQYALNSFSCIL